MKGLKLIMFFNSRLLTYGLEKKSFQKWWKEEKIFLKKWGKVSIYF